MNPHLRGNPASAVFHPPFFRTLVLSLTLALGPAIVVDAGESGSIRVLLDQRAFDSREPAKADFLDCPDGRPPCQAVAFPRVMADEKIVLPRNKPMESLRFLTLKGIRVQGGDPMLTIALYATGQGDSVFMDMNNDEDLGNDGPGRLWPKGDSCVTLGRGGGSSAAVSLCRAGAKAKAWQAECEGLKTSISWAMCQDAPLRVRILDLTIGALTLSAGERRFAVCDADGDGSIRFDAGDRLVIDWDGDGVLEKSLEADGIAAPGKSPFRFSLDSTTFEVLSVDEKGNWIEFKRLYAFDPAAASFKAVEGRAAPDIRFVNLDGDTLRLSDFKGKKVLVHFWSTLCKPCLDDLSGVREFHRAFGSKNWQIISLTTESDLVEVQQAALKHRMDWMVGMAGPEARRYYATRPLPLKVKIDEKGVLEKKDLVLGKRSF